MSAKGSPVTPADLDARAAFAASLAREAGALGLRYFNRELSYTAEWSARLVVPIPAATTFEPGSLPSTGGAP